MPPQGFGERRTKPFCLLCFGKHCQGADFGFILKRRKSKRWASSSLVSSWASPPEKQALKEGSGVVWPPSQRGPRYEREAQMFKVLRERERDREREGEGGRERVMSAVTVKTWRFSVRVGLHGNAVLAQRAALMDETRSYERA